MTTLPTDEIIHILLVDDQEDMRKSQLQLLKKIENIPLHICVASSGKEALQLANENEFALIILDVQMPDMDGFETAAKLHSLPQSKHTPIMFITSSSRDWHFIHKGYQLGAVDYLFKPVQAEVFLSKVRVFLDLYHQRQIIQAQKQELDSKMAEMERLTHMLTAANLALQEKSEALEALATQDGLTGLANRRYFEEFFSREWKRCRRNQKPLSLVMIDIDYFKAYNDHYGHIKGDDCLKQVAQLLTQAVRRPTDLAARYGGEEFALVLADTPAQPAFALVKKMYQMLDAAAIPHAKSKVKNQLTLSSGIATTIPQDDAQETLIKQADTALYQAKDIGRNHIILFEETP